jgi:NAD kinase
VTPDVACTVLVDGHSVAELAPGREVSIYLCAQRSLLATLPETTFFSRYRETFSS